MVYVTWLQPTGADDRRVVDEWSECGRFEFVDGYLYLYEGSDVRVAYPVGRIVRVERRA